jgi:uncharacterized protein YciI
MFIVRLTYRVPVEQIDSQMEAHRAWVEQGFADGIFVASGPLIPRDGGVILAHGINRTALERLLASDPFALHGMATADVIEMHVRATDPRLDFLKSQA